LIINSANFFRIHFEAFWSIYLQKVSCEKSIFPSATERRQRRKLLKGCEKAFPELGSNFLDWQAKLLLSINKKKVRPSV
jgi:hypothetical protein